MLLGTTVSPTTSGASRWTPSVRGSRQPAPRSLLPARRQRRTSCWTDTPGFIAGNTSPNQEEHVLANVFVRNSDFKPALFCSIIGAAKLPRRPKTNAGYGSGQT